MRIYGILISLLVVYTTSTSIIQNLKWSGGWCSICDPRRHDYACSNGVGHWNQGYHLLYNFIPANNRITEIIVTLHGVWGCAPGIATVNATLQHYPLDLQFLMGTCLCGFCDEEAVFHWQGYDFPGYNFGHNAANQLQIQVLTGLICVEEAIVNITYHPQEINRTLTPPPGCDTFGGCGNGTCQVNLTTLTAYCKCPTDYYGPNCQCYIPSYFLETDDAPVLDVASSGFKSKDTLFLTVNNSAKYYDTTIVFLNSINGTCDYPNPSTDIIWTKTFDPVACRYVLQGIIPWAVAWPQCIFNKTVTDQWLIFEGEMIITNEEYLGQLTLPGTNITLTRTIISDLPFVVRYPTGITLSTANVTVFGVVDIQAAIVYQEFTTSDSPPPGTGLVKLETLVQYPFLLLNPVFLTSNDSQLIVTIFGDPGNGVSTCLADGQDCIQLWDIYIYPDTTQCTMSGLYLFGFTVACFPSFSPCPLVNSSTDATVSFILTSGYFCAQIVETVDLRGQFTSYGDSNYLQPKSNFLVGQEIYFLITVASTQATIISTNITQLVAGFSNGTLVTLYQGGDNTPSGTSLNLMVAVDVGLPTQDTIQLYLSPQFFSVDNQLSQAVNFEVYVQVTYFNTQKRTIMTSTYNSHLQINIALPNITVINPPQNESSTPFISLLIMIILGILNW